VGYDEAELAFHRRVRAGFLDLARLEPERIEVVDASGPAEHVAGEVARVVGQRLGLSLGPGR
jgi:dTMP kinase